MTSDESIERVAQVIASKTTELGSSTMRGLDRAILAARALADAGLLAPALLREEWAVECLDWNGELRYDRYDQRVGAERMCWEGDGERPGDRVVRRLAAAWEPVQHIEGDEESRQ